MNDATTNPGTPMTRSLEATYAHEPASCRDCGQAWTFVRSWKERRFDATIFATRVVRRWEHACVNSLSLKVN